MKKVYLFQSVEPVFEIRNDRKIILEIMEEFLDVSNEELQINVITKL